MRRVRFSLACQYSAEPSGPNHGSGGQRLRLHENEGYEHARRVRNVIAHLRRGCAAFKPLMVVMANSGAPEEVKAREQRGKQLIDFSRIPVLFFVR